MYKFLLLILLMMPYDVLASKDHTHFFDTSTLTDKEQKCHAMSMIGFDSVINARFGLTPNHVFDLLVVGDPLSSENLPILKIVLGAYKWTGSKHSYAIHVFADCISR